MSTVLCGEVVADPSYRADVPADVRPRIQGTTPDALLVSLLAATTPFRFDTGAFVVVTDRRWYATATEAPEDGPMLVIRRWPGDTVLALYALAGTPQPGDAPAVTGARFGPVEVDDHGVRTWRGTIEIDRMTYPARWSERAVEGMPARLGALMLPGDAGLGDDAVTTLGIELEAVWDRIEIRPDAWTGIRAVARGRPVPPPALPAPPGEGDERTDAWQTVVAGEFSIGLPPGLRARRSDVGFPPPNGPDGTSLWIRGRFTDRDGIDVAIGDGERWGYVAKRGDGRPLGVPENGRRVARVEYPSADDWIGGEGSVAERWEEPGFEGEWLVFRIPVPSVGSFEIGLPVRHGRRSLALFWIPLTVRDANRPPAPPPIDPASRFGIDFQRLGGADRREQPWLEGYLEVPGLRLEMPRDWWPIAALRSPDGYPIRLWSEGTVIGRLIRLADDDPGLTPEPDSGWTPGRRPGRHRAAAMHHAPNGAVVFVSKGSGGFLLAPDKDLGERRDAWDRMVASVSLRRVDD